MVRNEPAAALFGQYESEARRPGYGLTIHYDVELIEAHAHDDRLGKDGHISLSDARTVAGAAKTTEILANGFIADVEAGTGGTVEKRIRSVEAGKKLAVVLVEGGRPFIDCSACLFGRPAKGMPGQKQPCCSKDNLHDTKHSVPFHHRSNRTKISISSL